jgi:hypothetical protein
LFRPAKLAPAPLGSWQTRGEVGFGIACSVQDGHARASKLYYMLIRNFM